MRKVLLKTHLVIESDVNEDNEPVYIFRFELGKNNIMTLVRGNLDELLSEIPAFLKPYIPIEKNKKDISRGA